jgi:HK97 family phage major capsid protein
MLKLSDASVEDVETRLKELKQEFIDLSEGRRDDVDDNALKAMIREVDSLDTFLTLSAAVQRREQAKIAATAGALTADGIREIGSQIVTEEIVRIIERSSDKPVSRTLLADVGFEGTRGREVSNWLQLAGMYGPNDGYRAAVTEWGSSGPGTTGPAGTNYDTTASGALAPRGQPIAPVPRQAKLYLRDLMSKTTTTMADVPYVRELNPTTYESTASGGATTVAEGSPKPTANLSFQAAHAPMTTVATTLVISKQMFADAPMVVQYINNRLPYLVKFTEDAQILNGNGTWPNNQGILNVSGIQTSTRGSIAAGDYAPQIGTGFALVENVDGAATAVVMNPLDAWTMFTKRAAGGSGTFDAGTPFSTLPLTVWGEPVYRSRVYTQGTALVADFTRGGMLIDRESVNVQVYNERYAEQNLVLLICEERLGTAWFRPDLFCQVTLS